MPNIDYPEAIKESQEELQELEKGASLHSPVSPRKDAQAPEVREVPQSGRSRPGFGIQLASVPEMVCHLQKRWPGGVVDQSGR